MKSINVCNKVTVCVYMQTEHFMNRTLFLCGFTCSTCRQSYAHILICIEVFNLISYIYENEYMLNKWIHARLEQLMEVKCWEMDVYTSAPDWFGWLSPDVMFSHVFQVWLWGSPFPTSPSTQAKMTDRTAWRLLWRTASRPKMGRMEMSLSFPTWSSQDGTAWRVPHVRVQGGSLEVTLLLYTLEFNTAHTPFHNQWLIIDLCVCVCVSGQENQLVALIPYSDQRLRPRRT